MSRRTMSGSELLAQSKNRHEQKNLKEKLDELTHGQFLVRDTSRVEAQKLRQFLKDNHRNTGWSPMAMKPEVPGEGEGGSDAQESLGGALRRRYDLQAITKYQRPWAYTLNTGDSPNKVYRELAQAGQSSKKALYTPRQATLALIGAVSFARGRMQAGRHPRLANTVPAVVGLERAKSAWIPGAHSNAGTFNAHMKLLSFRQNLKPTPFTASDQQNQFETTVTFSTRGKSKLERQVSTVSAVTRAKSSWFRGSKPANNPIDHDRNVNHGPTNGMGKQNVHDAPVMARNILARGGFKKAVDSWMCSECGGDSRELEASSTHNVQVAESSSFYDASVALKGLHRAKTVLDGLLYKQSPNAEVEETTTVESAHDQPSHRRRPCTCEGAQTSRPDLPKKQNHQKTGNKKQRKRQKQKKQAQVPASKSKCSESDKSTQNARPKSVTIARRSGVVGRPKGLFDTQNEKPDGNFLDHNTLDKTNSEENYLNVAEESVVKSGVPKRVNLELELDELHTCKNRYSSFKNLPQTRENKNDADGFDEIQQVEDATTLDLNTKAEVGKSMAGPISSLRLGHCNDLSPVAHTEDVVLDYDAHCDSTPASTDPLGKGMEAFVDTEVSKGQVEGCSEIDKTTHEERLELQDAFDATPVKKGKIRSLSTVRRRKFSFVSTAVGAFVKTSSTDDLGRKLRSSRVRSYSVTSQSSVDSVGTSVDGGTSGGGGDGSGRRNKWQLENIICASNLARYTGRLPRNENGEVNYTRPWRQKKKKRVSKMEVNVFYAIARYMLQKQKQLRAEKLALKARLDQEVKDNEFVKNGEGANVTFQDKAFERSDTRTLNTNENINTGKVSSSRKDDSSVEIDTTHNKVTAKTNIPKDRANSLIPSKKDDLTMATITNTLEKHIKEDARITPTAIKKAIDRASFSSSIGNGKKKTRTSRSGSAVASTLDPDDIPNLASIIDPSKSPINLTNGVLDYDDDLSTLTSGVMLIPGRKQIRYKGILLRNYVCPQERYKTEPHMRRKKTTSIRWHAKEGAMVMSHHSVESEPASKMATEVFPKQARQRALAKMVEDNHSQPVDNSARMADAALRQKIDKFLTSVESLCPKKKLELFS